VGRFARRKPANPVATALVDHRRNFFHPDRFSKGVNHMRFHWIILAVLFLSMTSTVDAQRRGLSVGDQAPNLSIGEWVHGEETSLQSGNVYVVEFWATNCVPCVQAIPKLSRLQRMHRDSGLVIIGISNEEADTVRSFAQRRASDITYRIAVDGRNATQRAWMRAAGRDGIPTAFIIDRRGRIQFIGNPHDGNFEQVLVAVLNDRYDARLFDQAEPILEAAERARRLRNWNQATRHFTQVIELDSRVFALVNLDVFEMLLVDMDDREQAYELARQLATNYSDDANFQINLARKIATDPTIPDDKRDMQLAMQAANRAGQILGSNHPEGLAVRAEINFLLGNLDDAISFQRRAWMLASPEVKGRYENRLQAYRDARTRSEMGGR
jgi:thiol-disulfide isomerase/thioredoxin